VTSGRQLAAPSVEQAEVLADVGPQRQTLVTQSTTPAPSSPSDSPASLNLTRSVGASAIKAALRNRAARLARASQDDLTEQ